MKINKWQRIGIIGSVLWLIGATVDFNQRDFKLWRASVVTASSLCSDVAADAAAGKTDVRAYYKCVDKYSVPRPTLANINWFWWALEAIVPIPLAWLFVYVVLFSFRWVQKG